MTLTDQLSGTAGTQGNTIRSYEGNGNQPGSYGISGMVTNTYNDLDHLTNVVGPGTNVSYVYDGQGDRLRSYEQSCATLVFSNDAQDLEGGLSDLVLVGTNDYTYLDPGAGKAPVAAISRRRPTVCGARIASGESTPHVLSVRPLGAPEVHAACSSTTTLGSDLGDCQV